MAFKESMKVQMGPMFPQMQHHTLWSVQKNHIASGKAP